MKIKLALFLILSGLVSFARNGSKHIQSHVEGCVIDEQTGEPLTGVAIKDVLSGIVIYTDLEGRFTVNFYDADSHTLEVSFVSYEEKKIIIDTKQRDAKITVPLSEVELY